MNYTNKETDSHCNVQTPSRDPGESNRGNIINKPFPTQAPDPPRLADFRDQDLAEFQARHDWRDGSERS